MSGLEFDPVDRRELVEHREACVLAALDLACAERRLSDDGESVKDLLAAEGRHALAARDYVAAVDALPPGRKPKGWGS